MQVRGPKQGLCQLYSRVTSVRVTVRRETVAVVSPLIRLQLLGFVGWDSRTTPAHLRVAAHSNINSSTPRRLLLAKPRVTDSLDGWIDFERQASQASLACTPLVVVTHLASWSHAVRQSCVEVKASLPGAASVPRTSLTNGSRYTLHRSTTINTHYEKISTKLFSVVQAPPPDAKDPASREGGQICLDSSVKDARCAPNAALCQPDSWAEGGPVTLTSIDALQDRSGRPGGPQIAAP